MVIIEALFPVFALIALGFLLRRQGFLPESFWPSFDRLNYWVLIPITFVLALENADFERLPVAQLAISVCGGLIATSAVLLLLGTWGAARTWVGGDGAGFTSVYQGGIRFNNFVALSAVAPLFGAQGVAVTALLVAVTVPLVNIMCIWIFSKYGTRRAAHMSQTFKDLLLNPLLLGCVAGAILNSLGGLPAVFEATLRPLAQAALPCGLLAVGAGLRVTGFERQARALITSSTAKFLVLPATTYGVCALLGMEQSTIAVVVFFQTLPTASSAYAMAKQLGGNAELMASIIAFQTILAILALPLALWLFGRAV
jgi:malonate transporter and related proteins